MIRKALFRHAGTMLLAVLILLTCIPAGTVRADDTPVCFSLMSVGDCVNYAGEHVVLITDVVKDSGGNVTKIEICENTPPIAVRRWLTPAQFMSRFTGYTLLRLKARDSVAAPAGYTPRTTGAVTADSWTDANRQTGTALSNPKYSEGVKNIVRRAYQQVEIEWTPLQDVEGYRYANGYLSGTFRAGTKYHGILYGMNVNSGFYVPHNRSFDVFLAAVAEEDSSFYTDRGSYGARTSPFYAGDCSSFVSYAYGLTRMTTTTIGTSNRFTKLCYVRPSGNAGLDTGDSGNAGSGTGSDGSSSGSKSGSGTTVARITMRRLYNPVTMEHLHTKDANEARVLIGSGWEDEGSSWTAPETSSIPVYRLFHPVTKEHFYTKDAYERSVLIANGWNDEGIGWYSADSSGVPVYRLYNAAAGIGAHHYTTDANERSVLIRNGWTDEGIGWYGLR